MEPRVPALAFPPVFAVCRNVSTCIADKGRIVNEKHATVESWRLLDGAVLPVMG
jgi:hypothetical protein